MIRTKAQANLEDIRCVHLKHLRGAAKALMALTESPHALEPGDLYFVAIGINNAVGEVSRLCQEGLEAKDD